MPKGRCSIALSPPSNADTTRSALHTLHPSLPTALSYAICSITCLMGFDASIALSTFFCLLLACLNNSLCRLFSPLYNYVPFYLPTPPLLFCLAVSCTAVFLLLAQVFCVDYWIIGHLSMDSAASHHWFYHHCFAILFAYRQRPLPTYSTVRVLLLSIAHHPDFLYNFCLRFRLDAR